MQTKYKKMLPICYEWEPSNCSITNSHPGLWGEKNEGRKEKMLETRPFLLCVRLAAGWTDTDLLGRGSGHCPGSGAGRYQGGEHCQDLQQGEVKMPGNIQE